jgi:hypothetical protein
MMRENAEFAGIVVAVATGNMELAFQNSTVMAWNAIRVPVTMLISIANTRVEPAFECPRQF